MTDADAELLDRLLAGDESAFERLVNRYQDRLRRLARTYVRTDALADDVVQETWLAVLRGLRHFEQRSTFRTWMFHILANRARTHAVRERRLVPFSDLESDASDITHASDGSWFDDRKRWREPPAAWITGDPEALALNQEVRHALDAAIETLPPGQRAVIVLRDLEGVSAGETCNILGISETNQRVLLHRGRTRVRRALAALLERR